jgi:hypothetical protein
MILITYSVALAVSIRSSKMSAVRTAGIERCARPLAEHVQTTIFQEFDLAFVSLIRQPGLFLDLGNTPSRFA